MKSTKIILGAIALVVTSASSMAFRAHDKFNNRHKLFTDTDNVCNPVNCFTELTGSANPNPCDNTITYFTKATCPEASIWTGLATTTN